MPEPVKHPVDPFFLSRYPTSERLAIMERVLPNLLAHAAALVETDHRDGALFVLTEATKLEEAISECRRSDHCGASPA